MVMSLYCLRDRVACDTAPVFESKNDGTALRAVMSLFKEPGAPPATDMELLHVGTVSHEDPFLLTVVNPPRSIYVPDGPQFIPPTLIEEDNDETV